MSINDMSMNPARGLITGIISILAYEILQQAFSPSQTHQENVLWHCEAVKATDASPWRLSCDDKGEPTHQVFKDPSYNGVLINTLNSGDTDPPLPPVVTSLTLGCSEFAFGENHREPSDSFMTFEARGCEYNPRIPLGSVPIS